MAENFVTGIKIRYIILGCTESVVGVELTRFCKELLLREGRVSETARSKNSVNSLVRY